MNNINLTRTPALLTGTLVLSGLLAGSVTVSSPAHAIVPADAEPEPMEPEGQPGPAKGAASCDPANTVFDMGCEIDMTDPVNPLWPCAVPGVTIESWNGQGLTLKIDMDAAPAPAPGGQWDMLQVYGQTDGISAYALNIGNSPTNNAWAGDANTTNYDAEAHLYNGTLRVWHGDQAGSGLALQIPGSLSPSAGFFEATVCDGSFTWESDTVAPTTVTHPDSIFQLRQPGDPDGQFYYVSFNQVIDGPYRSGSGIDPYPYLILSAF